MEILLPSRRESLAATPSSLSVSSKNRVCEGVKNNNNLPAEKVGKHHLGQVIKVNVTSDKPF